jgi:DHA1 family tetracycline resistance protein-like MFS transporter
LGALNFLYGLFVLPESLPADKRRKFEWRRANPLGAISALSHYPAVTSIAGAVFLWQLAHQVYPATWSFFSEIRYQWGSAEIGASLTYVGVLMAFTQAVLTGRIVKWVGEYRAVIIGLTSGVAGMLIIAFSNVGWLAYVAMTAGMLQFIAYPSMNAIMSKQVPPESQGELQGGVASMMSLTTIIGPVLLTQTLGRFSAADAPNYFPGAAFLLASVLALAALAIVLRIRAPSSALPEREAAG